MLGEDLPTGEDINLSIPETTENLQQEEKQGEPVETLAEDHIEENVTETLPAYTEELSVDSILDSTIAAIESEKAEKAEPEKDINKDLAEILGNVVQGALEKTATAGAIAAAGAIALEAGAAAAASEEVIKLASVAGELVDNVVGENLEKQTKKS